MRPDDFSSVSGCETCKQPGGKKDCPVHGGGIELGRPRMLVCFCCQGGEAMGYHRAGWDVEGVDINPQPRFPFKFHQADAIEFVKEHGHKYAAIVGGPPCQAHTKAQRIQKREHPRLIAPFRQVLIASGKPYVIENVEEARDELVDPQMLCGTQFGLKTDRHRLFETNWPLVVPEHHGGTHFGQHTKMGRPWKPGTLYQAIGNFSGVEFVRQDLDVPWMNRDGIRECIPPVYAEYIGRQLLAHLTERVAA
jgi:DNA (cytosine-5)-methyltransferase 1